jgi:hypothetical protein
VNVKGTSTTEYLSSSTYLLIILFGIVSYGGGRLPPRTQSTLMLNLYRNLFFLWLLQFGQNGPPAPRLPPICSFSWRIRGHRIVGWGPHCHDRSNLCDSCNFASTHQSFCGFTHVFYQYQFPPPRETVKKCLSMKPNYPSRKDSVLQNVYFLSQETVTLRIN